MTPVIPTSALPDASRLEVRAKPSRTYKLDIEGKRIVGITDGLDAVSQMIYKTLSTERYAWLVYNWNYGVELEQYIGQPYDFVAADIERAVTEALLVDNRVLEVRGFSLRRAAIDALYVEFVAVTTEGEAKIMWEVRLP